MLKPDEFIDSGFAMLKTVQPRQATLELIAAAHRQETRTKIRKGALGLAAFTAVVGAFSIAMKPTSALAALRESARLTAAQPILHVHFDSQDVLRNPTSPPWPQVPRTDIWRFPDRYMRKHGTILFEAFKTGKTLSYDSRFSEGFRSTYDAANDRFWRFDGTIGEEIAGVHQNPPRVHDSIIRGARYIDYEWQDVDGMHNRTTSNIYIDPKTKLVRFSDSDRTAANGDKNHSSAVVEFPSKVAAEREVPRFPKGLKFRTSEELLNGFNRQIGLPDQTKVVAGIRTTLYGVVIHPNVPDGLGVDVITQGGAGPDFGSGHRSEVVGSAGLPVKRSEWYPPLGDPAKARFGFFPTISGRKYIVNQSDDLLFRAPSRITVRVPVWRLGRSTIEREGKSVHPHEFVGYATFTTSKLFYSIGDSEMNFYGRLRD